jgi:drug/metabolite transporter (DMT)-like permease
MSKESLERRFFLAVAAVLAAAVLYGVVSALVEDFTGSSAHDHHGLVLVVANVIWLGLVAPFVAWLALLSWRRAKSN